MPSNGSWIKSTNFIPFQLLTQSAVAVASGIGARQGPLLNHAASMVRPQVPVGVWRWGTGQGRRDGFGAAKILNACRDAE